MAVIHIAPKAFFFDFDGVIVDSEHIHMAAALRVAQTHGISFDEKYYFDILLGFDDAGLFARLWQDNGRELSADLRHELSRGKNRFFLELVKTKVNYFDGVIDFIKALAERGIPLAVVSGALKSEIAACLAPAKLDAYFSYVVSAEDVAKSKPSSESYQRAFELMQKQMPALKASECWAIEDSSAGIESAKGAGLHVLGITHSLPASELRSADAVVRGFNEIVLV